MATPEWVNIRDYDFVQDAVDYAASLPTGAVVYVPFGTYAPDTQPAFEPPLLLPHDKPIAIVGDGPYISRLDAGPDPNVDIVRIRGDYQTIEGLSLSGPGVAGSGVGVRIRREVDPQNTNLIYRAAIRNCEIRDTPNWGIMVDDTPRDGVYQFCVWAMYDGLELHGMKSNGCIYLGRGGTTAQYFRNCTLRNYRGIGVQGKNADGISLENCRSIKDAQDQDASLSHAIDLEHCNHAAIRHCWFEGVNLTKVPYVHCYGEYNGLMIDACSFRQRSDAVDQNDLKAVHLKGFHRGSYVGSLDLRIPGVAGSGQGEHIYVWGPSAPNLNSEVLIGPSSMVDSTTVPPVPPIRIRAESPRVALANGAFRDRIVRASSADIGNLMDLAPGDLIFNSNSGKAQMYDGSQWRNLW